MRDLANDQGQTLKRKTTQPSKETLPSAPDSSQALCRFFRAHDRSNADLSLIQRRASPTRCLQSSGLLGFC